MKIPNEEARYNVYRSEAEKVFEKINPEPLRNSWFVDSNVRKGFTYRYRLPHSPREGRRMNRGEPVPKP